MTVGVDMDSILIRELEVYAGHGVYAEETLRGQMFLVSAELIMDLRTAGLSDDLDCSADYGRVCHFIHDYLRQNTFLLIEAAAEHLAREILVSFPQIMELELEIKKPHAPVGLPFACVSVKIRRGWKQVFLGIGSNMGDKERYLEDAVDRLKAHPLIRDLKCSEWMVTAPYGGVMQDDFLNGAVGLKTLLFPDELLAFLHELEQKAGRERKIHWGPRTLDLDILLYQDYVSDDPELTVPHPDMGNRRFVLEPLSKLCPNLVHPVTGKTIRHMLQDLLR